MEKIIRKISIIVLIISLLLSPFMFIGGIYGLAGSTASFYMIIWVGYVGLIISSILCIFKYKFFPLIIISIILIIAGIAMDTNSWSAHNNQLCNELRAEPTCIEDECGFICSNFQGVGFATGGSVCRDKDPNLCKKT